MSKRSLLDVLHEMRPPLAWKDGATRRLPPVPPPGYTSDHYGESGGAPQEEAPRPPSLRQCLRGWWECIQSRHQWSPTSADAAPRWCMRCGLCPGAAREG